MASDARGTHRGRLRQITRVLVRHGLGYFVGLLGLERFVPFHWGLLGHARRAEPYTRPEHVRLALEELGTAFIKLGQILSTRPDLVPPAYQVEFAKLQDAAPPVPIDAVRAVLLAELGRSPEELFAHFDSVPLATGSIGQAHAATLHDGTEVVVKVRRPGVVEQVESDLEILQNLAVTASRHWQLADRYDVVGLAQEFAQTLRVELDYIREGRNAQRFAANFAGDADVHIPRIYWERTTARVITLERIRGTKISDVAALDAAGIDRPALAERSARILLKMVFEDGFFHADPHPGNFFVEAEGCIGLIDFGMVGTIDERTQDHLVELLLAITGNDAEQTADALLDLGVAQVHVDHQLLATGLSHLLAAYTDRPLSELRVGPIIAEVQVIVRQHQLQLPPNLALLLKTVAMSEGLGAQLDPAFALGRVLAPYAERLLLRRFAPARLARRLREAGVELSRLAVDLPRQLRRLTSELDRGGPTVGVRPEGFEPVLHRLERLTNRLVLGIIAAAFVNGLAVLMTVYHPPGWSTWAGPTFGVGVITAAVLGLYLAWSIVRSGKR